jgi:protoporphyrinogen oxidase
MDATSRVLILGAGPTGLGAAYRLAELGHQNFTIVDRNPYIGGLAHSFVDPAGFTWDIGGHVMFSHYEYYDRVFERLMGPDFTLNNRESWVRIADRWVPYPFQNNIRYLPPESAFECMRGLLRAQGEGRESVARAIAAAGNFAEFCHAVFGDGICAHFMTPYNFKVWAHPLEMMNKTWIGERVAVIDAERALRNVMLAIDDFGWGPNNQFKFPLRGGTGEFYARFAPILGDRVALSRRATHIDINARTVRFDDGSIEPFDALVSTMPLDVLCRDVLVGAVPDRVRDAAGRLRHSAGHMVGIGLRRAGGTPSTKSWMYFPESNCPFYRVTYLSNYSPFMTPDKDRYFSLLCETSASEFKPVDRSRIVEETIQGLIASGMLKERDRDAIATIWHHETDYSYPVPTIERDAILSEVIPWLESVGIHSRGRFGMWKYEVSNTDHSLMQGVELIDRLLLGKEETTIGLKYAVTEDGLRGASHTRSPLAGSGERRVAPPEVTIAKREPATPSIAR